MKRFVIVGLVVSFIIAGGVAHFAASAPDGLEKVMEDRGVEGSEPVVHGIFPDYEFPILGTVAGNTIAGLAGTAIVFVLLILVLKMFKRSTDDSTPG